MRLLGSVIAVAATVACAHGADSPVGAVMHAPVAPSLSITEGAGQSAEVGTTLPRPVSVRLADRTTGQAQSGRLLLWVVTKGGGRLTVDTTRTDADGRSQQAWTLGHVAMEDSLEVWLVSSLESTSVTVGATATHGPPLEGQRLCDPLYFTLAANVPVAIVDSVKVYERDRYGNVWSSPSDLVVRGAQFSGRFDAGNPPPYSFTARTVTLAPSDASDPRAGSWAGAWVLKLQEQGSDRITCSVGAVAR